MFKQPKTPEKWGELANASPARRAGTGLTQGDCFDRARQARIDEMKQCLINPMGSGPEEIVLRDVKST